MISPVEWMMMSTIVFAYPCSEPFAFLFLESPPPFSHPNAHKKTAKMLKISGGATVGSVVEPPRFKGKKEKKKKELVFGRNR